MDPNFAVPALVLGLVYESVPGSMRGRRSYIDLFCSVLLEPRLVSASNSTIYCSNTCVTDLITAHPNLCGSYLTHGRDPWRPRTHTVPSLTLPWLLVLYISLAYCLSSQHATRPPGIIQQPVSACVSRYRVLSSLTDPSCEQGIDRPRAIVMAERCSC